MLRGRNLAAWLMIATTAAAALCVPITPAAGQSDPASPTIAVGSIGATVPNATATQSLRDALETQLATLGGVRLTPTRNARYVVRGSVTRLERQDLGHSVQVDCEVSLVVADRRGGSIKMMLSGRAGARGAPTGDTVEQAALQAAVRGALRPLSASLPRGR